MAYDGGTSMAWTAHLWRSAARKLTSTVLHVTNYNTSRARQRRKGVKLASQKDTSGDQVLRLLERKVPMLLPSACHLSPCGWKSKKAKTSIVL